MRIVASQRVRAWKAVLLGGIAAVALGHGSASAQASANRKSVPDEEPTGLDEVVVTGKFQNSLINRLPVEPMKLPFSLDVVGQVELRERGFFNPLDILETLPNVVRRNTQYLPTGGSYVIRGLYGTVLTNNRPENDSRGSGRRDASQIERFEVLKGPTSILLGPVIPGGVINQVTKSPKEGTSLELIGRAGSYGTYRVEADANQGDLLGSGVLGARLTVAYEDQQGPQDVAHVETFSIRPVIEANFSDRTRAQASLSYTERQGVPFSSTAVNSDGSVPDTIDEKTYFGVPSKQRGEDTYVDAEFQHEFLDNLKLVVRGSYQDTDFDYQLSQSSYNYTRGRGFGPGDTQAYVYYGAGYRNSDVLYSDVQLVGAFDAFGQKHDWVVGASRQEFAFESYYAYGGVLGVVDINNLAAARYGVPDFNLNLLPYVDYKEILKSVYAEGSFRFTDRLTVVAGVRYDDHERRNRVNNVVTPASDTTFRVGGTYELTDGLNAYVSYAEGFVPQTGTTRSGDPITPETAVNLEAGLKGRLLDGRLGFTTAVFHLTRQNVSTPDPANMAGGPAFVIATGEQVHKGFELNARLAVTPALSLDFGYGYVDAEVTKKINAASADVGDPVPLVPKHTFSAFGSYVVQDGPLAKLRLGLGVRGISDRPAPQFDLRYGGYTLVDALIAYPLSERIDVQVNVHNLLNKTYRETPGFSTGNPGGGHRFGNPRSAYVTARARF